MTIDKLCENIYSLIFNENSGISYTSYGYISDSQQLKPHARLLINHRGCLEAIRNP